MRRDRIANEKIIDFFVPASRTVGTHTSGVFDLRQGGSGEGPGREIIENMMLMITVGATWGGTNTITITVNTGDTSTVTAYATIAAMSAAESQDLYLAELKSLQRYIQLSVVLTGTTLFSILGSGNRSRREPVIQLGTEKTVTYSRTPATG